VPEPWERSPDVHCLLDHVIVPIVRLDARNVTKLLAVNGTRSEYRDELLPAFFLRVSPSGARTFGVAYNTPAGQRRRYTIGNAARTSLADARDVARRVLADVVKGEDPQQQKIAERRKRRAGVLTFTDLARRFMRENEARLAATTRYNWTNIIESEIARGSLGTMRPDEITRQDVRELIRRLAQDRPFWANRTFEVVRRVFTWAVTEDLAVSTPCLGLRKPTQEQPRDRVLSSDEIRAVWAALDPEGVLGEAVRLVFYTAARRREVLDARWTEVDMAERLWRLSSTRTKNRQPHVVPLSTGALAVLTRLRAVAPDTEWIFPSPAPGSEERPLQAVAKHMRRIVQRSGVTFWLHDVRRTVRTRLAEMGVPENVAEAVLGHALPRLIRTYNRHEPIPEMRSALEAWSARLDAIVNGTAGLAEVVAFARA
jgi:integrase